MSVTFFCEDNNILLNIVGLSPPPLALPFQGGGNSVSNFKRLIPSRSGERVSACPVLDTGVRGTTGYLGNKSSTHRKRLHSFDI